MKDFSEVFSVEGNVNVTVMESLEEMKNIYKEYLNKIASIEIEGKTEDDIYNEMEEIEQSFNFEERIEDEIYKIKESKRKLEKTMYSFKAGLVREAERNEL